MLVCKQQFVNEQTIKITQFYNLSISNKEARIISTPTIEVDRMIVPVSSRTRPHKLQTHNYDNKVNVAQYIIAETEKETNMYTLVTVVFI